MKKSFKIGIAGLIVLCLTAAFLGSVFVSYAADKPFKADYSGYTNYARNGATAKADSIYNQGKSDEKPAANAIDNNMGTYWQPEQNDVGTDKNFLKLEWGDPIPCDTVLIFWKEHFPEEGDVSITLKNDETDVTPKTADYKIVNYDGLNDSGATGVTQIIFNKAIDVDSISVKCETTFKDGCDYALMMQEIAVYNTLNKDNSIQLRTDDGKKRLFIHKIPEGGLADDQYYQATFTVKRVVDGAWKQQVVTADIFDAYTAVIAGDITVTPEIFSQYAETDYLVACLIEDCQPDDQVTFELSVATASNEG